MNERANEALANLLQLAVDGVEGAVEFSKAQIPEVVEQLLMWHMLESMLFFVVSLSAAYLAVTTFRKARPSIEAAKEAYNRGEKWTRYCDSASDLSSTTYDFKVTGVAHYAGTTALIVLSLATFSLTWLKILVAPKLYLLEYAADLVK